MATALSPNYVQPLRILAQLLKVPEPIPEYKFHLTRRWKVDFAWVDEKIILEVEGEIYGTGKPCFYCKVRPTGGHSSISGILRDIEKYNEAAIHGWIVLRVLPEELTLENGKAFNLLEQAFKLRALQSERRIP